MSLRATRKYSMTSHLPLKQPDHVQCFKGVSLLSCLQVMKFKFVLGSHGYIRNIFHKGIRYIFWYIDLFRQMNNTHVAYSMQKLSQPPLARVALTFLVWLTLITTGCLSTVHASITPNIEYHFYGNTHTQTNITVLSHWT